MKEERETTFQKSKTILNKTSKFNHERAMKVVCVCEQSIFHLGIGNDFHRKVFFSIQKTEKM